MRTESTELCARIVHFDDCLPTCGEGSCNVGRKHLKQRGVCCGTCYSSCDACGGLHYLEDMRWLGDDLVDGDGCEIEGVLCHCCHLKLGRNVVAVLSLAA